MTAVAASAIKKIAVRERTCTRANEWCISREFSAAQLVEASAMMQPQKEIQINATKNQFRIQNRAARLPEGDFRETAGKQLAIRQARPDKLRTKRGRD
jgi:hypothetical protein